MNKVVCLTGSELRHTYFKMGLANAEGLTVLRTYCEGTEQSLSNYVDNEKKRASIQYDHISKRELSEQDFFGGFVELSSDRSLSSYIPKGEINDPRHEREITHLAPDLLVCYGCSLIKEPLLSRFKDRILNVHLGLSPYYRGAGTNFHALVNGEFQCVGATFMYIDAGIDTGEIIHQIRARIYPGDSPHQIGNRLIADMVSCYIKIIRNFDTLIRLPQPMKTSNNRMYYRKDFTPERVQKLYEIFGSGAIERYLQDQNRLRSESPIIENNSIWQVDDA